MAITLNGTTGITTPTYGGAVAAEYIAPVTSFKNRIINGAMQIDQRGSAGTPVSNGAASNTYFVDRWHMFGAVAARMNGRQSAVAPTGFTNSSLITSLASTTPSAGDAYGVRQIIEGFNAADLGWGTASAQTVTISFWVRSSITGTYAFSFFNENSPWRAYVSTYTISATDTWEQKSITVVGDTSGTWNKVNGGGIQCWWDLGSGTGFNATAGSWNSSLLVRTAGSVNWVGTNGATFYITGVQLEKGSNATSFDYRPYGTELALCQRYCFIGTPQANTGGVSAEATQCQVRTPFNVPMRSTPTITVTSGTWQISDDFSADVTATNPAIVTADVVYSGGRVYLSGFSSLTTGRWYAGTAVGTAKLIYSAEL